MKPFLLTWIHKMLVENNKDGSRVWHPLLFSTNILWIKSRVGGQVQMAQE